MNDAGNFLIETCDEVVSRDLKQQLLLLNGRWRDLFMEVKQVCLSDLSLLKMCMCCKCDKQSVWRLLYCYSMGLLRQTTDVFKLLCLCLVLYSSLCIMEGHYRHV